MKLELDKSCLVQVLIVPEIGEEFDIVGQDENTYRLKCTEATDNCKGCFFYHFCDNFDYNPTSFMCHHEARSDEKDVIFEVVS